MKRLIVLFFLLPAGMCFGQQQELTVKTIYGGEGGSLTGRAPDTIKWSPDGTKVSYIVHDEQGENAQLYYIDATTGKPAVLVASEKLAAMKPPDSSNKDDRERDNRARYHVAAYHWAPDSDLMLYPRKTHSISGPAARIHLFTRIHNHFRRELLGEQPMEPGKAE